MEMLEVGNCLVVVVVGRDTAMGWTTLFLLFKMAILIDGHQSPFIYGLMNMLAEMICPLAGCRIE